MDEITVPADTPCAECGEPIGARAWEMVEGRVYHREHVALPREKTDQARRPTRPRKPFADHARAVLNPGQETLDGD